MVEQWGLQVVTVSQRWQLKGHWKLQFNLLITGLFVRCDWGKTNLFWKPVCSYVLSLQKKITQFTQLIQAGETALPRNADFRSSDHTTTPQLLLWHCWFCSRVNFGLCPWGKDWNWSLLQQNLNFLLTKHTPPTTHCTQSWLLAATSPPQMSLPLSFGSNHFVSLLSWCSCLGAGLPSPRIPSDTSAGGFISWGTFQSHPCRMAPALCAQSSLIFAVE